jgi:hypothetical protein
MAWVRVSGPQVVSRHPGSLCNLLGRRTHLCHGCFFIDSQQLPLAAPSVPSVMLTPAWRILGTGAMPDAIFRLESGQ